jgi:hypothetical protein
MKIRTRAFGEDCKPSRFQGRGSPASTRFELKLCAVYRAAPSASLSPLSQSRTLSHSLSAHHPKLPLLPVALFPGVTGAGLGI